MLPVGDKPVIERIVKQLRDAGVRQVNLATRYKAEAFASHFGDGAAFGIAINHVTESEPLGTAGVLATLRSCNEPLLVVNGDILTRLNYRALVDFHRENRADMTVGLRRYDIHVPYGVVQVEGAMVQGVQEKPVQKLFVNAGIYLVEPAAVRYVPDGQRFDMTDLIAALVRDGRRVVGFPISEYWLDIGQPADYEQAQLDVKSGALKE
jgi:NDP-sugar pyrophosphorylase family protein